MKKPLGAVLTALIYLALGFGFGTVMTFGHQASFTISGMPIYWGIGAASAGTAGLLVGVRLVASSRAEVIAVAVGVVGSIAVLSLPGPSGSVLIPANPVGYIWSFAPAVVALGVAVFPRLPRAR